MNQLK